MTLDTSGVVSMPLPMLDVRWTDLDPLTQGYIEGLLSGWIKSGPFADEGSDTFGEHRFSDLSREALARIIADCAIMLSRRDWWGDDGECSVPQDASDGALCEVGAEFWSDRQAERWPETFPPLTPYLADDGQVHLKETR